MLSENGCLEQNVQDRRSSEKKGVLSLSEQGLETLKSIESNQALESLIMNSGVAMKYGNDSSAELNESWNSQSQISVGLKVLEYQVVIVVVVIIISSSIISKVGEKHH
ncbi:UNVERIFIED_CONTAM: hypothetical protein K2H54_056149 [Gekko kuhli]